MLPTRSEAGNSHTALSRARAMTPPRVILFWCLVLAVVAALMYAVAPWILPVRVIEGPMVQMADEQGATLVWYLSRPAACRLVVTAKGAERVIESTSGAIRHAPRLDGLAPGNSYAYRIESGTRRLTSDLVFQTSKSPEDRYSFIVFGDSGKGSRAQYRLADAMLAAKPAPDFLLHTGDIVYPDGARYRYGERFFAPYRKLLARVDFWPCLGNHDVQKDGAAPAYDEIFELPDNGPTGLSSGHNYWFEFGSARVAVVDSNLENADDATLAGKIAPWLLAVMSGPGPEWRFVALHHPPYTVGKYRPDERIQRALVPVFEQAQVDVVFNGHDHGYQRWLPMRGGQLAAVGSGVMYVITGAGGAELYDAKPRDQWPKTVAFVDTENASFTQVTIDGRSLTLRQLDGEGRVLDEASFEKPVLATAPASQPVDTAPAAGAP